jgi:hypothetical protein
VSPTGALAGRFAATRATDRQILADAQAAAAWFLVTGDVDDFDTGDLDGLGVTAINPDLYLSTILDSDTYQQILHAMVAGMTNPSRAVPELHALLGRQHPRLVARFVDDFTVVPNPPTHREPAVLVRGRRCVRCAAISTVALPFGLCPDCAT